MRNSVALVTLLGACAMLQGCFPVVAGGAAATGYAGAQERSVGTAVDDVAINAQINHYLLQSTIKHLYSDVDVDVHEGRVLLTGKVVKPEHAVEAVRLSWKPKGVREVINELQVTDTASLKDYTRDVWITTQVKSRLLLEKNLRSVNYNVETVNQIVYMLGIAQSQQELERATYIARTVKGVKKVISHVRLKDGGRVAMPSAPGTGYDSGGYGGGYDSVDSYERPQDMQPRDIGGQPLDTGTYGSAPADGVTIQPLAPIEIAPGD